PARSRRGVRAGAPLSGRARRESRDLARTPEPSVETGLPRNPEPLLEQRHALRRRREREVTALDPLDIGVELPLETAPDAVRLHHERHLERIPPLLPHEPPVAARLLAGDLSPPQPRHPPA